MASSLVHVANLTVVARLRGAECRSPVFQTETQRNYSGEQPGMYHQRIFHLYTSSFKWFRVGRACSPQSIACTTDWRFSLLQPWRTSNDVAYILIVSHVAGV